MRERPSTIIANTLDASISALKPVVEAMKAAANASRYQFLLPESEQGLQGALFAYLMFLTVNPLSGNNRTIKQLLADYANEWSFLFDAIRDGDSTLATPVKDARAAQKAAHARLVAILDTGNGDGRTEYDALTTALTALSEKMGDNAQAAAKRSRKGCKRDPNYATPAWQAAIWANVGEATIHRYWDKPKKGLLRPPLTTPGTVEARKSMFEEWGRQYHAQKAGASEARAMNHAARYHDIDSIGDSKDDSEEES